MNTYIIEVTDTYAGYDIELDSRGEYSLNSLTLREIFGGTYSVCDVHHKRDL